MPATHSESRSSFDRKLTEYIQECVLLYHTIHRADERVHAPSGLSHAERDLLFALFGQGAQTVPTFARQRSLTRQRVQQIANALYGHGLIRRVSNPASARSPLYVLTERGRNKALAMLRSERRWFRGIATDIADRRLSTATRVMRIVREDLERKMS